LQEHRAKKQARADQQAEIDLTAELHSAIVKSTQPDTSQQAAASEEADGNAEANERSAEEASVDAQMPTAEDEVTAEGNAGAQLSLAEEVGNAAAPAQQSIASKRSVATVIAAEAHLTLPDMPLHVAPRAAEHVSAATTIQR